MFNKSAPLQYAQNQGHGGSASSQHIRYKLMRDADGGLTDAVGHHQEPSRKPLLNLMQAITRHQLRKYECLVLHMPQQKLLQIRILIEIVPQSLEADP